MEIFTSESCLEAYFPPIFGTRSNSKPLQMFSLRIRYTLEGLDVIGLSSLDRRIKSQ